MDLLSLNPEELEKVLELSPSYRNLQIFRALHKDLCVKFQDITTLPKSIREELAGKYSIKTLSAEKRTSDSEGTVKILFRLEDGSGVEAVLLKDGKGRSTACLSTQVGCAMGCVFCRTASMGFIRDLSASEILGQFFALRRETKEISNIVFMGMGEPLANFSAVMKSAELFHHPEGSNIGYRRITLSTSGYVPGILRMSKEGPPIRLAVSLVSADQKTRETLMPVAKSFPLEELKDSLRQYQRARKKRITLEWVLLPAINSGVKDAEDLKKFAESLSVVVNVIPWNGIPGYSFREPTEAETAEFIGRVESLGLPVTRRFRKGKGILGACGQLAT